MSAAAPRSASLARRWHWVEFLRQVPLPIGAAAAAAWAVARVVRPEWRAPGLPYLEGYGKNVEFAAVAVGFAAAAASQWLVRAPWRAGRWSASILALAGAALLGAHLDFAAIGVNWLRLPLVLALVLPLLLEGGGGSGPVPESRWEPSPRLAWGLVAALACAAFVLGVRPLTIDVFHHGEVLGSAIDLLRGGHPFRTFIWPHGAHDSGLTALWIGLTGKIGTSPVALASATCTALGVVSVYLLGCRLLGSRLQALALGAGLVGALALAPFKVGPIIDPSMLNQLGILFFVVAGLVLLTKPSPLADLLAGASFAAAYLFRIEAGVFGFLAAIGLLLFRDRARGLRSVGRLLLGAATMLALCRLALGWPGAEWFSYTLGDLATYHRDSSGIPIDWPLRGFDAGSTAVQRYFVGAFVSWLVFVALLVAQAARLATEPGARTSDRTLAILFAAGFAVLAARSILDRSDGVHVLQWRALPVLVTLLVAVALARDRRGWGAVRTSLLLAALPVLVDLRAFHPAPHRETDWRAWKTDLVAIPRSLLEHLRRNPAAGPCADRSFTPTEARLPANRDFIAATCEVESLLGAHGIDDLVVVHSAPWYDVRFGQAPLSRYFAPARAYSPRRQEELIETWRARRPQALLLARGHAALTTFDVPDAVRIPVVDAFVRARREAAPVVSTPLGDLYLWNEPSICSATDPAATLELPDLTIAIHRLVHQSAGGVYYAEGEAVDRDGSALARLSVGSGHGFPFVSTSLAGRRLDLFAWKPPSFLPGGAPVEPIDLTASTVRGAVGRIRLELGAARQLATLTGPEWNDLADAVGRAAQLGQRDRAASCAACVCSPSSSSTSSP